MQVEGQDPSRLLIIGKEIQVLTTKVKDTGVSVERHDITLNTIHVRMNRELQELH